MTVQVAAVAVAVVVRQQPSLNVESGSVVVTVALARAVLQRRAS